MNAIQLRINHGRWIADCPRCNSAMAVQYIGEKQLFEKFACFDCGYGLADGFRELLHTAAPQDKWRLFTNERPFFKVEIVFPDECKKIESELVKRERMDNWNWNVGETVEDLIIQNNEHGVHL